MFSTAPLSFTLTASTRSLQQRQTCLDSLHMHDMQKDRARMKALKDLTLTPAQTTQNAEDWRRWVRRRALLSGSMLAAVAQLSSRLPSMHDVQTVLKLLPQFSSSEASSREVVEGSASAIEPTTSTTSDGQEQAAENPTRAEKINQHADVVDVCTATGYFTRMYDTMYDIGGTKAALTSDETPKADGSSDAPHSSETPQPQGSNAGNICSSTASMHCETSKAPAGTAQSVATQGATHGPRVLQKVSSDRSRASASTFAQALAGHAAATDSLSPEGGAVDGQATSGARSHAQSYCQSVPGHCGRHEPEEAEDVWVSEFEQLLWSTPAPPTHGHTMHDVHVCTSDAAKSARTAAQQAAQGLLQGRGRLLGESGESMRNVEEGLLGLSMVSRDDALMLSQSTTFLWSFTPACPLTFTSTPLRRRVATLLYLCGCSALQAFLSCALLFDICTGQAAFVVLCPAVFACAGLRTNVLACRLQWSLAVCGSSFPCAASGSDTETVPLLTAAAQPIGCQQHHTRIYTHTRAPIHACRGEVR